VRSCLLFLLPLLTSTVKASATVAGLAAYLKGLQPVVPYTVASLKAEIIALQWARPSYSIPGNIRDPRLVVFPPAIYNGENQYLMCSKNLKRQDGIVPSGCSIGSAPTGGAASQASPITVGANKSQIYRSIATNN
jgi:hypothetical protein